MADTPAEFSIDDIVTTAELAARPSRPPDHAAENRALLALIQALADSPGTILQALADTALELCRAGSSGISLSEPDVFRWHATAGAFAPYSGGTMPRLFSPCATVLERDATQLMADPARHFRNIEGIGPAIAELLLVPFHRGGVAFGTVWIVSHRADRLFDGEDRRLLESVARFAEAAVEAQGRESERRELADRHAEESRHYDQLLTSMMDFAYTFDLDGRLTFANKPLLDLWGRTLEESVGKDFFELRYPDELAARLQRQIRAVIATKQTVVDDSAFVGANGIEKHFQYILSPVIGPGGTVEAVAGSTRDVTEQKRGEEIQRSADRRKDEFLATLAHELRNPLAPVRHGLQVLKLAPPGPVAERAREMMERQLAHMVRLIDDLLDVSRITSGKIELRVGRVNLRTVIDTALETSRSQIDAGRHALTLSMPGDPIHLDADLTRMAQVVGNLLTNAAKYTPDGGRIELVARREGDWAVVTVKDSGVGIPPEMRDRVFEMFTQVNKTLDRSQGGLGIGLALVRRLVEMHGGNIGVESAGTGMGSTFTLRLPIAEASETEVAPPPAAAAPATAQKILVVDDNEDGAESLTLLLTIQGHDVRTAYSGVQAIEVARAFRPDVVLLDIGLPGMNGYEVAKRFRADDALRDMALIAITGLGSDEDKRRAGAAGFDLHLTKPAESSDIERAFAELATGSRR